MSEQSGKRFGFGKNWQSFLKHDFSEHHLEIAQDHLLNFLQCENLEGKTFLDIGSGSGIHSLAAYRAGAKKIISFDYDQNSVEATKQLRAHEKADTDRWEVMQGSVLDPEFLSTLGTFDIVYSWGVLHHTGDLWRALNNLSTVIENSSLVYIALYASEKYGYPSLDYWLNLKQEYLAAPVLKKRYMELKYVWKHYCKGKIRHIPNLLTQVASYRKNRGMALYTDVKDWLGGWPMEFSSSYEVVDTARNKMGLDFIKHIEVSGCTEYLFCSHGSATNLGHSLSTEAVSLYAIYNEKFEILTSTPVWIYGSSTGGDIVYEELKSRNIPIGGFINSFQSGEYRNLPILKLADFVKLHDQNTVIIIASVYGPLMRKNLLKLNFTNLIDAHSLIQYNV